MPIRYTVRKNFLPFFELPFHFDTVLCCTKVFNIDEASFIYLKNFIVCVFAVVSKKPLPNPISQMFMTVLSSASFIPLALTFMSLIHFEFHQWYEVGVQLHSFACGCPVVSAPFIEKNYSFPKLSWHPC